MENLKMYICCAIGAVGGFIAKILGGWDSGLITLFVCIVADYITGILVAGVFNKSTKRESGSLESRVGLKGLIRKVVMIGIVAVAHSIDVFLETDYIRNAVIIGFVCNEVISLTENAGLMGVPIPNAIINAIDVLKNKECNNGNKKESDNTKL